MRPSRTIIAPTLLLVLAVTFALLARVAFASALSPAPRGVEARVPLLQPTPTPVPRNPLLQPNSIPSPAPVRAPVIVAPLAPAALGNNVQIDSDGALLHQQPLIGVDPLNPNRMLVIANNWPNDSASVYYYLSLDGGQTWPTQDSVPMSSGGGGGDARLAFDKLGNGYVIQRANSPQGIYVGRLQANNTWNPSIPISTSVLSGEYVDEGAIAADLSGGTFANRVYAVWADILSSTAEPVLLKRVDAGNWPNFSSVVTVSPPSQPLNSWPFIAVGADGSVYVAYVNMGATSNSLIVVKSTDGGVSFSSPITVSTIKTISNTATSQLPAGSSTYFVVAPNPVLATHPTDPNKLAITWMDGYNCVSVLSCPNGHVVVSITTNGGTTWSAPKVVNDDGDAGNRDHFFPAIAAGPDGALHMGWYDRRASVEPTNPYLYNEFYSYSSDWGQTWAPNTRVSTASSNPANPLFLNNQAFLGWYSGIAVSSDNRYLRPTWLDMRAGAQNLYTALSTGYRLSCSTCLFLPFVSK